MDLRTQKKLKQAIFPDFPREQPTVDKEGKLTAHWHLQLSSLFQALQRNFSNEGLQIPRLSIEDINTIEQIYNPNLVGKKLGFIPNISGHMVYDTSNNVPKMFIIVFTNSDPSDTVISASWKTFTLV